MTLSQFIILLGYFSVMSILTLSSFHGVVFIVSLLGKSFEAKSFYYNFCVLY